MPSEALRRLAVETVTAMEGPEELGVRLAALEACHASAGAEFADELSLYCAGHSEAAFAGLQAVADETIATFRGMMGDDYTAVGIPPALAYAAIKAFREAFMARIALHVAGGSTGGQA